jgi:putative inorganic carbon (hco3(-)) transporter
MNSLWTKLSLSDEQLRSWLEGSSLYQLVVVFRGWRQSSWVVVHSQKIGALLISLVLAIAPFMPTTSIGIVLFAIGAFWVLLTLVDEAETKVTSIHLLVFVYWVIATLAVIFSPVKSAAFAGWVKLTLYLLFFALATKVLRSPRVLSGISATYLLVSLVVSVYGVRQQFIGVEQLATWNDPNSPLALDTRVYSYLGNPNLLAGYLLSAIAFSIAAVFTWQGWLPKATALVMVTVNSSCLYFTDSRGGWIGMLILIFTFLLLLYYWWHEYLPNFWRKWLLPISLGSLAGLLLIAVLTVEPVRLRVFSIFAGREDSSNNFRLNVWLAAIQMIRDRPLIGIGPGNDAFNQVYALYMHSRFTALSAYSIFLETAVETGLIGLGCFLAIIAATFKRGVWQLKLQRDSKDPQAFWIMGAIAAMAGMLAHGLVDTVWYRPEINTLWWLMLAIIASHYSNFKINLNGVSV